MAHHEIRRRLTTLCLMLIALIAAPLLALAQGRRIPWQSPNVIGSPEAPPPFELKRIFPKLKFNHPVDIAFAPGIDRIFVADQSAKVVSFDRNDPDLVKPDLVVNLHEIVTDWKAVPGARGLEAVYGV